MNSSEKRFYSRLAIIWAVVTAVVALVLFFVSPEVGFLAVVFGALSYAVVFLFLRLLQWLLG